MASSTASSLAMSDYPDFLSPLLVKEFRMGLGSRMVVFALLGIQLGLGGLTSYRVMFSFTGASAIFPSASAPPSSPPFVPIVPPGPARPMVVPSGSMRPMTALPGSMRPVTIPPGSVRTFPATPSSVRHMTAPPGSMRPVTVPPGSVRTFPATPSSVRPMTAPPGSVHTFPATPGSVYPVTVPPGSVPTYPTPTSSGGPIVIPMGALHPISVPTAPSMWAASVPNMTASDTFYWLTVVAIFHVLLPFRQVIFGDEDARGSHSDLLLLAGMGQELTRAKWIAQSLVSLLMLVSILPYAICRSYCAGVNVIWELMTLIWIWVNGFIFNALGIAVGSFGHWARILCTIPLVFFFIMIEGCCWLIAAQNFSNAPALVSWICAAPVAIQIGLSLSFLTAR